MVAVNVGVRAFDGLNLMKLILMRKKEAKQTHIHNSYALRCCSQRLSFV